MRKAFCVAVALGATILFGASQAAAVSSETDMLLQLLQKKGVITQADVKQFKAVIDQKMAEEAEIDPEHHHTVQGVAKRLDKLERAVTEVRSGKEPAGKVQLSGVMEVNATAGRVRYKDSVTPDENSSDIILNTAELDADAAINDHVSAHLALLYEEDSTNNDGSGIVVDEGIINLDGGAQLPLYLWAGKMYLPFGYYASHFITDPLTLTLGRIRDTAVIAGYHDSVFDFNAGVFKGEVRKTGSSSRFDSFVGSAAWTMPKGAIKGLALTTGLSYTSNLATSDTLQGRLATANEVTDMVGGYSVFLHMKYMDYSFDAEYLAAASGFANGDMNFIAADNNTPAAWNFELAAELMPKLEAALRYGGSSETGGYRHKDPATSMAQSQVGGLLAYDILDDTTVTFEYLHDEYKNEIADDLATLQLAVEF
ncbi:MAG: LbtU family siderophore porin [Deltaproteobacteria bacterium]|nr:LbtU family siderophore porin [Deltaproteobacteria bacterium]